MADPSAVPFDAAAPWRLSPEVSLRDEPFGALAYHHRNRRLVFLKTRELASLVTCLDQYDNADRALDALVEVSARASYLRALGSLADAGIIRDR
ncbi:MAG: mycofactocin biosynthesis chaperone MftB [Acidimicrobiales bacterium]